MHRMRPFLLMVLVPLLAFADEKPQTQGDVNEQARKSLQVADKALNETWKQVLAANAENPKLVERLKAAQKTWLTFRDAQVEALWGDDRFSARPMCQAAVLEQLTRERTAWLKELMHVEEGDVCASTSAPVK